MSDSFCSELMREMESGLEEEEEEMFQNVQYEMIEAI